MPPAPMTLDRLREEFPHTRTQTYLNHASTGVYSQRVANAIHEWVLDRSGREIENFVTIQPRVDDCLARIGRLLNVPASRVEFTANTSDALALLAEGLDLHPGDRVAVPACEFPANVYPFLHLERKGVAVDFIPHTDGVITLADIERTLTPRTRLVSVSWVQFLSGYRLDVKAVAEIVHAHGAFLCVDGIQGLGALRLDVADAGIDFLACGAQKWLLATQGLGFLYCSEALQARITPRAGWLHGPVDWENFFDYRLAFFEDARRFRIGTLNHLGVMALRAALELYEDAGPAACEARVLAHAGRLRDGFAEMGLGCYGDCEPAHASGIVTIRHADPDGLYAHLRARGISASCRNRLVRFSPTYYNSAAEIDRALDAVETFAPSRVAVSVA